MGRRCRFWEMFVGEWGKRAEKEGEEPWESDDGSGLPSWAREVPWSDEGTKSSSAEEQLEAINKSKLMEQCERDLGSGGVDVLATMDTKQAEEVLMQFQEHMKGISEEKRKMAVWSMMWMVEKRKEERLENDEKKRAPTCPFSIGREKILLRN